MKRVLLYYPTIDIPSNNWLNSALLYADKISSLTPFFNMQNTGIPKMIKYLYDEGQYDPLSVNPDRIKSIKTFEEFKDFFFKSIESKDFQAHINRKRLIKASAFSSMHEHKLPHPIKQFLREKKLLFNSEHPNSDTHLVEETTSLFYLGLLAQHIAISFDDDLIIPSTDDKRYENIVFGCAGAKTPAFSLILNKLLPVPQIDTPLEKIITFKRQRKDELFEFRKYLSIIQNKLTKATDKQEIKEILIDTREDIEKNIRNITKTLKDAKIKNYFISFESILNLERPKLFQSLTTAGIISTTISPIAGISIGSIGIIGNLVSSFMKLKNEIDKSEFSYLFRAEKEGIIKIE